jgi:hypothetical protein
VVPDPEALPGGDWLAELTVWPGNAWPSAMARTSEAVVAPPAMHCVSLRVRASCSSRRFAALSWDSLIGQFLPVVPCFYSLHGQSWGTGSGILQMR